MLNEFVFEFMIKGRGDNPDDAFNDALEEYMPGARDLVVLLVDARPDLGVGETVQLRDRHNGKHHKQGKDGKCPC